MRRNPEAGAFRPPSIALVFWLLLAAFFTTRTLQRSGAPFDELDSWARAAVWNVPSFLLWGLVSPLIERLRRRFPLADGRRSHLYLHAFASVVVAPLHLALLDAGFAIAESLAHRPLVAHDLAESLPRLFHLNVLLYWAVVLGGEALAQARRGREEGIALARLEAQLAEARLAALRMQLHPHFLFNTLNSIAELMHADVAAADRMLGRLAGLLETALGTASEHEVRLADELAFLERYLEVEHVRFRDRLSVRYEIDPEAAARSVPALVLQPLVENAVRHGVGRLARGGEVIVRAALTPERLTLEVENDAPAPAAELARATPALAGRAAVAPRGPGVGLANTAERLRQLYGERARIETHRLAAGDAAGARFLARIEIDAVPLASPALGRPPLSRWAFGSTP